MAEFNKEELFARWRSLSKSELENLRRTLSDGEEIAAFDEFLSLHEKQEIMDIINGVQNSETEADYFASMEPKLTEEQIDIATSFDKPEEVLESLGTTDNLLTAYEHYKSNGNSEKVALVQSAIRLSIDDLISNPHVDITSNNAYSWLKLLEKSGIADESKVHQALSTISTQLKAYDDAHFGELSDDELAQNYEKANMALSETFKDCGYEYLQSHFTFTNDKGTPLADKNLVGKAVSRFFDNGDGKDLSNCQNSIVEMARELVAQDLAKKGMTVTNEDGTQRDLGQNDYEALMRDKICLILGVNPTENGGKIPVKQSNVVGRLGAFMTGAEEFKQRAKQKGFNNLYTKSTNWLKRLDDRLVERFGNDYVRAKNIAKTLGKAAKGAAIGAAKFALVSAIGGPAGVAAYIGYNTYKQWKNTVANWEKMDGVQKTGAVIGNTVSSAISITMATIGLDGVAEHLSGPVGTFATNLAQNVSIWGRSAITTLANSTTNLMKEVEFRIKNAKIDKELKDCKDPKRVNELLKQRQDNIVAKRKNREALVINSLSAMVGTGVGLGTNQTIAAAGGLEGILGIGGDDPQDVRGAKAEGTSVETAETPTTDTSTITDEVKSENLDAAKNTTAHPSGKTVSEMLTAEIAREACNLGDLSPAEQQ